MCSTHVLVCGEISSDQVRMEAWEAQNRPNWKEAHHELYSSAKE